MRLVLASQSPRRAELLAAAGFSFEIAAVEVDESRRPDEAARVYVARVADAKALDAATTNRTAAVIGADTIVTLDGSLLGKPADDREAAKMLKQLAGKTHEVLTGVVVRYNERHLAEVEVTKVHFLPLSAEEIAWYVATGEPRGKAGAYAIQGRASRFVDYIEGPYSNVVGLPIAAVYRMLCDLGWKP